MRNNWSKSRAPREGAEGGWSQGGYKGWVDAGWVIKKIRFWQKRSQFSIFMVVPPFWSSRNLTGGSGMGGKVDPN
jgi:hypothetical protein